MPSPRPGNNHPRLARDLATVPNLLSLSRVVLVWAAVLFFASGFRLAGVIVGMVAGLTDTFDGILARRLGQVTALGGVLDLFADLVFESTAILTGIVHGALPAFCLVVYLARELFVVSARFHLAFRGQRIPSSFLGRTKSTVFGYGFLMLFAGIGGLLPSPLLNRISLECGAASVFTGLLVSVVSGLGYVREFVRLYEAPDPAPPAAETSSPRTTR